MKQLLPVLIFLGLSVAAAVASDWEEDSHPTPQIGHGGIIKPGTDSIILDDNNVPSSKGTKGTVLQGSATAIQTRPVMPSSSAQAAQVAARWREMLRIDADAGRFLQQAPINAVVQPSTFRAFIEKNHAEYSLAAENNIEDKIVLVRGQWDDSTKPLHSFGLRFDPIKTKELPDFTFDKCKVLIIDCAGEIPNSSVQKIRDFVMRGGYLLSTDWSLQNVLERSFPEYIRWNRDNTDGVITDAYITDPDPSLMKGLDGQRYTWKLDRMSQCVRVLNPGKVHVIARSSKLAQTDPQLRVLPDPMLAGGVALEFGFGRGKVLHLVGHFDNCSNSFRPLLLPDPAPGVGISLRQALAANFIMEALTKSSEASTAPAIKQGE